MEKKLSPDSPPPPPWWNKIRTTLGDLNKATQYPVVRLAIDAIDELADNAKWQTQRRFLLERTKNCLREWARVELVNLRHENLGCENIIRSASSFLDEHLKQDEVRFMPGNNRHKPDILIDQTLALRFVVNPDGFSIDDMLSELTAMARAFTTCLVICNAQEEVQQEAYRKLGNNENLELLCLPGGIVIWQPPKWEGKRIFLSYCDRDEKWAKRLRVHLNPLRKKYGLLLWDTSIILPGADLQAERVAARSSAQILIIMLSADYLDKEHEEQQAILDRAEISGDMIRILPLYIGYCNSDVFPRLRRYRSINRPNQPLNVMKPPEADAVLNRIGAEIELQLRKWYGSL